MHIEDDVKRLAKLLMSVNVSSKKVRPLTPIETAREIQQWMEEKNLSKDEMSKKLRLKTTDMITQFLSLLQLPDEIQHAIEWGKNRENHLGFSAATELSTLTEQKDMAKLAKAMINYTFSREEVEAVIGLKKRNSEKSIEDCIYEIKKFRLKILAGYLIVSPISEKNREILKKYANLDNITSAELLRNILEEYLPKKSISSTKIREEGVTLSLDEVGYEKFNRISIQFKILLKDTIDFLIERKLGQV